MNDDKKHVSVYNLFATDRKLATLDDKTLAAMARNEPPAAETMLAPAEFESRRASNLLIQRRRMATIEADRQAKADTHEATAQADKQAFLARLKAVGNIPREDFDLVAGELWRQHLVDMINRKPSLPGFGF